MTLVQNEKAFLLHSRKYTDNKIILDLLTEKCGLVSAVLRTTPKKSYGVMPTQFTQMLASWRGRGELKSLDLFEPEGVSYRLVGSKLYCGFYVNELLMRLLPRNDPHVPIFESYIQCLEQLMTQAVSETGLRQFELSLLNILGYGIDFERDCHGGRIVSDGDHQYYYVLESGFHLSSGSKRNDTFSGAVLQAISSGALHDAEVRLQAKKLCRFVLNNLLGSKPLKSRDFFA